MYVQVMERAVSVEEMLVADEMFGTGTAVVVNSVASVTYKETRLNFTSIILFLFVPICYVNSVRMYPVFTLLYRIKLFIFQ